MDLTKESSHPDPCFHVIACLKTLDFKGKVVFHNQNLEFFHRAVHNHVDDG